MCRAQRLDPVDLLAPGRFEKHAGLAQAQSHLLEKPVLIEPRHCDGAQAHVGLAEVRILRLVADDVHGDAPPAAIGEKFPHALNQPRFVHARSVHRDLDAAPMCLAFRQCAYDVADKLFVLRDIGADQAALQCDAVHELVVAGDGVVEIHPDDPTGKSCVHLGAGRHGGLPQGHFRHRRCMRLML